MLEISFFVFKIKKMCSAFFEQILTKKDWGGGKKMA